MPLLPKTARHFEPPRDLMELKTLLEERMEEWITGWKQEGKADLLKRLLTKRFGPLPAWVTEKLDTTGSPQLDIWADRIFDASTLETFFDPTSGAI